MDQKNIILAYMLTMPDNYADTPYQIYTAMQPDEKAAIGGISNLQKNLEQLIKQSKIEYGAFFGQKLESTYRLTSKCRQKMQAEKNNSHAPITPSATPVLVLSSWANSDDEKQEPITPIDASCISLEKIQLNQIRDLLQIPESVDVVKYVKKQKLAVTDISTVIGLSAEYPKFIADRIRDLIKAEKKLSEAEETISRQAAQLIEINQNPPQPTFTQEDYDTAILDLLDPFELLMANQLEVYRKLRTKAKAADLIDNASDLPEHLELLQTYEASKTTPSDHQEMFHEIHTFLTQLWI